MNAWQFTERIIGPLNEKVCVVTGTKICVNCGLDTITISKKGIRCKNWLFQVTL